MWCVLGQYLDKADIYDIQIRYWYIMYVCVRLYDMDIRACFGFGA